MPAKDSSTTTTKSLPATQAVPQIVGIGASAGGLEALELFLKNVPPGSGLAFVIVQHMDPTYKGIMVELLQRATTMPVAQITDCMRIEPNHVYVIPPNRDLSILHGVLHLLEPVSLRGLRLPIDFFLRSLAEDQHERSIGVILSGMGSDGTLGLRAIKENAGVVFVQSLVSAKFDGMPRSAIEAGLADIVAPAEELAAKILTYLQHVPLLITKPGLTQNTRNQSNLEKIILLLRLNTGHDFSLYKKNTLYRRIERRMGLHQLNKIAEYLSYMRSNSQEVDLLFRELLVGVTGFFRDPAVWEQLKNEVFPALLTTHPNGGILCVPGPRHVRQARKPFRLPWSSARHWSKYNLPGIVPCRYSPPIWMKMLSKEPGLVYTHPTSPRIYPKNACSASSSRKNAVIASIKRSGKW